MSKNGQASGDEDSSVGAGLLALGALSVMALGAFAFVYLFVWSGGEPSGDENGSIEAASTDGAPPAPAVAQKSDKQPAAAAPETARTPDAEPSGSSRPSSDGVSDGHPYLVVAPRGKSAEEVAAEEALAAEAEAAAVVVDPLFTVHKLEHAGSLFSYDPHTKRLAVAEAETQKVRFYEIGADAQLVGEAVGPVDPTAIWSRRCEGRSFLFIGGGTGGRIDVYSIDDAESIGALRIANPKVTCIGSSTADEDPWVYFASESNDDHRAGMQRFAISNLNQTGTVLDHTGSILDDCDDFAISPAGDMIYTRRTNVSPTGMDSWRIREQTDRREAAVASSRDVWVEPVIDEHDTAAHYVPDPLGILVACGEDIRSASLHSSVGKFDFIVQAFLPGSPWVVGIEDSKLHVGTLNGFKKVKELTLPLAFANVPSRGQDRRSRNEQRYKYSWRVRGRHHPLFLDGDRLIAVAGDRVAILGISSLGLSEEPFLAIDTPAEVRVGFGEQAEVPLRSWAPEADTHLVQAPDGAQLKEGAIKWPLSDDGLGRVDLTLERSQGVLRWRQQLRVNVVRPHVDLGFRVQDAALSNDGTVAVVVGSPPPQRDGKTPGQPIAIVETSAARVLARGEISASYIHAASIDDTTVHLLVGDERRLSSSRSRELVRLSRSDLALVAREDTTDHRLNASHRTARVGKSTIKGGVVWDRDTEKAEMLIKAQDIVFTTRFSRGSKPEVLAWGCENRSDRLFSPSLNKSFAYRGAVVWDKRPVIVELVETNTRSRETIALQFLPLDGEQQPWRAPLCVGGYSRSGEGQCLDLAGDTLAVVTNRNFYLHDMKELINQELSEPLHFELSQPDKQLETRRSTSVRYRLRGGKPPYQIKAVVAGRNTEATVTDSGQVKLQVDSQPIAEDFLSQLGKNRLSWPIPLSEATSGRGHVSAYLDLIREPYKKYVGKRPRGVPVAVSGVITATDADGTTVSLHNDYLIELSSKDVVEKLAPIIRDRQLANDRRSQNSDRSGGRSAPSSRREERERAREVDQELAVIYSNKLREAYSPADIPSDDIEARATTARQAITDFLSGQLDEVQKTLNKQVRTWTDRRGRETQAALVSFFAGDVVLRLKQGREVTVPAERLSDKDQAFLEEVDEAIDLTAADHPDAAFQLVASALSKHLSRTGQLPPAWIVDSDGEPLLSWRVALLADLGGGDLLRLFHLDEPWDSEHNQRLHRYVPAVFATDPDALAQGRATVVAVVGRNTLLSGGRPRTAREVTDGFRRLVTLVEAKPDRSVEWTKPGDIPAHPSKAIPDMVRQREGRVVVSTVGQARRVKGDTTPTIWRQLVDISDGKP